MFYRLILNGLLGFGAEATVQVSAELKQLGIIILYIRPKHSGKHRVMFKRRGGVTEPVQIGF